MELLVSVMKSAAELVHSVFGKELKPNWEQSIQNLSKQYCLMRNTIEERAIQNIVLNTTQDSEDQSI